MGEGYSKHKELVRCYYDTDMIGAINYVEKKIN